MAVASIDLCEGCEDIDETSPEKVFRSLDDEYRKQQQRFRDDLSSGMIIEDDLKRCDEIVVAMLCEGNYVFGKKPRSRSNNCLFLRDDSKKNVAPDLVIAARSHAHLLPSV